MSKHLFIASLAFAACSCANVAELQPQAGKSLPQKPALASRPCVSYSYRTSPPALSCARVTRRLASYSKAIQRSSPDSIRSSVPFQSRR